MEPEAAQELGGAPEARGVPEWHAEWQLIKVFRPPTPTPLEINIATSVRVAGAPAPVAATRFIAGPPHRPGEWQQASSDDEAFRLAAVDATGIPGKLRHSSAVPLGIFAPLPGLGVSPLIQSRSSRGRPPRRLGGSAEAPDRRGHRAAPQSPGAACQERAAAPVENRQV